MKCPARRPIFLEDVPGLDHLVRQFLGSVYWIASYYRSNTIEKGKTTADISMLVTACDRRDTRGARGTRSRRALKPISAMMAFGELNYVTQPSTGKKSWRYQSFCQAAGNLAVRRLL